MTEQTPAPAATRRARRSRRHLFLIAGGLVLLAMPVTWLLVAPDPSGPRVEVVGTTDPGPPAGPPPAASRTPGPAATTAPAPAIEPVAIDLPTLALSAPVVPVGVEPDGLMEVPADVRTVGWYRFGPSPGSAAGSAVLGGHVNDREQGVGVFARIAELDIGDAVVVRLADGTPRQYRVVAREQWPKAEVPLARLFDRGAPPRLVLITCGGIFERGSRNYQDNIAITAVPA